MLVPDIDHAAAELGQPSGPLASGLFCAPISFAGLPAVSLPLHRTAAGLPVGVQIIGAEGEDPTTIEFARLLAAEIGGFVAPPGYA